MDIVHPRCAGIDISKGDGKVAVRIAKAGRAKAAVEVRTYGSSTPQVLQLRDWLIESQVTCVVMEATGDYWRTFYYLLEDAGCELLLANPREVRNRPGRKTDVSDAQWLAELGALGLVNGSFVPPAPIRDLRALTRLRTHLARDRALETQRLEKVLEDAGIKLSTVATRLAGVSSRAMLQALASGAAVEDIVQLAQGALRRKQAELSDALTGRFTPHHGFMVEMLLGRIDTCDQDIAELTGRIEALMEPYRWVRELLVTIPGLSTMTADVIIAETGGDMAQFPDAKHLASWAGVAPGSNQSAGVVKSARVRPGDTYLKGALGIAALQAARSKKTYFSAQYRRIATRRGPVKALVAVENSIITAIWYMLTRGTEYVDPGVDYYTRRRPDTAKNRAIHQLESLGYNVTITPTKEPTAE
jgi:transposase